MPMTNYREMYRRATYSQETNRRYRVSEYSHIFMELTLMSVLMYETQA